jgi:hypothetical protein
MTAYGAKELADSFRTVRRNTIQIAKDIPESSYDFVPAPGARSVAELLRHIIFASNFYEDIHRVRLWCDQPRDQRERATRARQGGHHRAARVRR